MIFKPEMIDAILNGTKTQTRRVCKPDERLYWKPQVGLGVPSIDEVRVLPRLRIKWQVGCTYAVVPKRGMPAVVWREKDGCIELAHERSDWADFRAMLNTSRATWRMAIADLADLGWRELRIRITAIRREPLQDITEEDAKAEGVESVEAYKALWDSINGKTKGARLQDNPDVWVLTFALVTKE